MLLGALRPAIGDKKLPLAVQFVGFVCSSARLDPYEPILGGFWLFLEVHEGGSGLQK